MADGNVFCRPEGTIDKSGVVVQYSVAVNDPHNRGAMFELCRCLNLWYS